MLAGIKEKKIIHIKNFFSKEELSMLQPYCINSTLNCNQENLRDKQSPTAAWFYNDIMMNIMLENKLKKAEEISNLKLFPTYAFWRGYTFGSILKNHRDRASCEISITACIDRCGTEWPIYFGEESIDIKIGDAVMYLGCDLWHGRKNHFEGDYMAQVFFHYVDQAGPYREFKYDRVHRFLGK